ncbi:MAG: DUF192 domain-containing protein [Phycisphaerae bacterium]
MQSNGSLSFLFPGPRRKGHRGVLTTFLCLAIGVCIVGGCGRVTRRGSYHRLKLPIVPVRVGNKTLKLWVASTTSTQERGLMYIRRMPDNRGMLFVFSHSAPQTFWMKHTRIALDLILLNRQGMVVRHYTMPPDNGKTLYPSGQPVRFAIELNAGMFKRLQLHEAMTIHIPVLPVRSIVSRGGSS